MKANKWETLGVSKAIKDKIKAYCDPKGISLIFFVESALTNELNKLNIK